MEVALVKCIGKLHSYTGSHSELVSGGSLAPLMDTIAEGLGRALPRDSSCAALTVAVVQRVWHERYPSLDLAAAALVGGKHRSSIRGFASDLQRALVALARYHGLEGYNLTALADEVLSRLAGVAAQLRAD